MTPKSKCECMQHGACPHGSHPCRAEPAQRIVFRSEPYSGHPPVSRLLCEMCTEHYLNGEHSHFNAWPAEE